MKKRVLTMFLVLVMVFGLAVPALAAEDMFQAEEPAVQEEAPAVPAEAEPEAPAEELPAETDIAVPSTADEAVPAATVLASGNCGLSGWDNRASNVKWTLTSDGTLTIYGKGSIGDYYPQDDWPPPWGQYCMDRFEKLYGVGDVVSDENPYSIIKKVIIQEGITRIGADAFGGYTFNEISFPNSLTEIGDFAFNCCTIKSITLPSGLKKIDEFAFGVCDELTSITIPSSVSTISSSAFSDCSRLKDVYYGGTREQWRRITISEWNDDLLNATIHYNSSGPAAQKDGWGWENNAHCYYRNGVKVRSDWVDTEGHRYWMKADGTMAWNEKVTVNGKDYYLGESGALQTGWIFQKNGDRYYADSTGALKKVAWQQSYWLMPDGRVARSTYATATYGSGSRIFSFSNSGRVNTGWIPVGNGNFRYGDPSAGGALAQNKWVYDGGNTYYVKDTYLMARNETLTIGNMKYTFNNDGILTNSQQLNRPLDNLDSVHYILQGDNQCYATAVTMAANLIVGTDKYRVKEFRSGNLLQLPNYTYKGTDGNTYKAVWDSGSVNQQRNAINNALNAGLPIVVTVKGNIGTHYLLIVGSAYNPAIGATDYYVVDPGYLSGKFPTQGREATYYTGTSLNTAKTFMDSIRISSTSSFRYTLQTGSYVYFQKQ